MNDVERQMNLGPMRYGVELSVYMIQDLKFGAWFKQILDAGFWILDLKGFFHLSGIWHPESSIA